MTDEVKYFPMDVRTLRKGDVITVKNVEELAQTRRDLPGYAFRVLWLRNKIANELKKLGIIYTLRIHDGAIVVCDDDQADQFNHKQCTIGKRRIRRSFFRNMHVDVGMLTTERRAEHERRLVVQGAIVGAISKAQRVLSGLKPKQRETPGLPKPSNGDNAK